MLLLATCWLLTAQGASAESPVAGRYRLVEAGPDVASELVLRPDGSFEYGLAAGALDEHAAGRWTLEGKSLRLTTTPKPVAPVFSPGPVARSEDAPLVLHVTGPGGAGLAGVDVRVGFDSGEDVEGYTQDYGWTLPKGERGVPRWVELGVPMHGLRSPRFPIDLVRGNVLTFVLTPNDLGVIDFTGLRIDVEPNRLILHRGDASFIFARAGS